jgi:hypothetical protein
MSWTDSNNNTHSLLYYAIINNKNIDNYKNINLTDKDKEYILIDVFTKDHFNDAIMDLLISKEVCFTPEKELEIYKEACNCNIVFKSNIGAYNVVKKLQKNLNNSSKKIKDNDIINKFMHMYIDFYKMKKYVCDGLDIKTSFQLELLKNNCKCENKNLNEKINKYKEKQKNVCKEDEYKQKYLKYKTKYLELKRLENI